MGPRIKKLLYIVTPLSIILVLMAFNGLAARNISAEVVLIKAEDVVGTRLHATAVVSLGNKGAFPVTVLGGRIRVYIQGVKLFEADIPSITLPGWGAKNVSLPVLLESAELSINGTVRIRVEGYVNAPIPVPVYAEEEKEATYSGKGYSLVDVVGLPNRRFKAWVKVELPAPFIGVLVNATIRVPAGSEEPMLITINDTDLSEKVRMFEALIFIPSNDTLAEVVSGVTDAVSVLCVHRGSWHMKFEVYASGASQDTPMPPATVESLAYDPSKKKVNITVAFDNPYSLEATLLEMEARIYADGTLIAVARAENETIRPHSQNEVTVTVDVIPENASALLKAGYLSAKGNALVRVVDTTYVIPIEYSRSL